MPRVRKKSWKTSAAGWTRSVSAGGLPSYAKQEFGNLYEVEPIRFGDRFYYVCQLSDKGSRIRYVNDDGDVLDSAHYFGSADAARRGAARHYARLRGGRHPHPLEHAFRKRFRRI